MKRENQPNEGKMDTYPQEIHLEFNHETIIGTSHALKYVLHLVEQVALTDTTVLILGETGTGKELVAREIHRLSLRKNGALLKINCAAPPMAILESKFFNHGDDASSVAWSGPFVPFAATGGKTLFLDEIEALPLELQAKLLIMMQEFTGESPYLDSPHHRGMRIIAATRHNLETKVREGKFHEELWHHLNSFPIVLPPLRNRLCDISPLVNFFVKKISGQMGTPVKVVPAEIIASFQEYHWPRNVKELKTVVENAVMNSPAHELLVPWECKAWQMALKEIPETAILTKRMVTAGGSYA